jgi:hypothetical protein
MQPAVQTKPSSAAVSIDPIADPRYDEFMAAHERAGAYHAGAWAGILRSAYGFRPRYIALEADGRLQGAMPLVYSRGVVSGKRLRGLPVVPPAGPLATSPRGEVELIEMACALADDCARELSFTSRTPGYESAVAGLNGTEKHPTWITPLGEDADELRRGWKKSSNNLFRNIAKSEKTGVSVREGTSAADLKAFYLLYLETMKRHRSLPRAWRQIAADMELQGPSGVCRMFLAEHDGRVVAAGLFHAYRDTVDLLYNGSATSERDLRANFALYWHVLRWSIENGYRRFDWGQAQEGGTLSRFKSQWSAEPEREYVYRYVPGRDPDGSTHTAESRADRIRRSHDALDHADRQPTRREQIIDGAWERVPLRLTAAAGSLVYRVF